MSAPRSSPCRFCSEKYTAAGIKNHEKYCSENPHSGVHPDDAPELFDETAGDDDPARSADPDQRDNETGGSSLPSRETLPADVKSSGSVKVKESKKCPSCGSSNTMPAHEARRRFQREMNPAPQELVATFDATERYCNDCYSVFGGELGNDAYCITEGFA